MDVVTNCPQVVEVEHNDDSGLQSDAAYMLQSPSNSSEQMEEVIPAPPLRPEATLRFSQRCVQNNMENVGTRATALKRKRNLEGTPINPKSNSFDDLSH